MKGEIENESAERATALADSVLACSRNIASANHSLLDRLGENAWSDAALTLAKEVLDASGMHCEAELGTIEMVRELHPTMMREDAETMTYDTVHMLTAAERLSFAATGSYAGSKGSVPTNIVQLFGNISLIEQDPVNVWASTLNQLGIALKVQIGKTCA